MNYYDLLRISKDATQEEIKVAYINMIKAFHPDYYNGSTEFAEEMSKEVNAAYSVLKDPEKRREYDRILEQNANHSDYDREKEQRIKEEQNRADEAEKRREEAEKRMQEAEKRREEAEKRMQEAEDLLAKKQVNDTQATQKEITLKTTTLYILAVVIGIISYYLISELDAIVLSFLLKVPVLNVIVIYLAGFPFDSGLGFVTIDAILSTGGAFYMAKLIIDRSSQKQFKWGYKVLAVILILSLLYLANQGMPFSSTSEYIFMVVLLLFAFLKDKI